MGVDNVLVLGRPGGRTLGLPPPPSSFLQESGSCYHSPLRVVLRVWDKRMSWARGKQGEEGGWPGTMDGVETFKSVEHLVETVGRHLTEVKRSLSTIGSLFCSQATTKICFQLVFIVFAQKVSESYRLQRKDRFQMNPANEYFLVCLVPSASNYGRQQAF